MEEMKFFSPWNEKCIKHFIFRGREDKKKMMRMQQKILSYAYFIACDRKREDAVHKLDFQRFQFKFSWNEITEEKVSWTFGINEILFFVYLQGNSGPRNSYPSGAPPQLKGTQQRPSGPTMTSPAGAITGAPYRGASWAPSYAPTQQAYRYTTPLAQPAYAYTTTQHTTATVSTFFYNNY